MLCALEEILRKGWL